MNEDLEYILEHVDSIKLYRGRDSAYIAEYYFWDRQGSYIFTDDWSTTMDGLFSGMVAKLKNRL